MCPICNPRNDFNSTIDLLGVYFIKTKKTYLVVIAQHIFSIINIPVLA